ncbi:glycosyltransferase family 39 protein [Lysobacter sp. K5869]|uniref:DUF7024 domain-containing protein n=1 Tax=Lysobacter sp. K5869 TaxID=2820808 RepID=UPI001C063918|nr:glycosyltransferase family 39 protein [Lysobacter sp. K5869]QWP75244.1 glycosyltransferase family 39 protein [Lysobacter sp. K5869]
MISESAFLRANGWHRWLLGAGALALLAAMTLRDQNLYAAVFADEWYYSAYSRLVPLSDSKLPSYLYLWVFRLTSQCGSEFLDCARALNALMLVASLPLIYRILRPYAPPALAALAALACVAAPVNSYAAYFMPESMYYLMFWVLATAVLRPYTVHPARYGLTAGAILGLMCLVKMHALFLALGFGLFVVGDALWIGRRERIGPAMVVAVASLAAFFAVRFGGGYLLAGPTSLNLLGEFYSGQAQGNFGHQAATAMAKNLSISAVGHTLALSLLFAPLLVPALPLLLRPRGDDSDERARSAVLFGLITLGSLVAITVYFTASMGANEAIGRLHLRYYNFCLPLLLLAPLAWRGAQSGPAGLQRALWGSALALAAAALFSGAYGLHLYSPAPADSPELVWALKRPWLSGTVGLLGAAACLGWVLAKDLWRARLAALAYFALVAALGAGAVTVSVRNARLVSPYVEAGQWLRQQGAEAAARSQVLAVDGAGLFKARFYADSMALTARGVAPGEAAEAAVDWNLDTAVLLDGLTLPAGSYVRKQPHRGFTVYWLPSAISVDLRQPNPASVRALRGWAAPEAFGRWSDGDVATIELDREVSGSLQVTLEAAAFGPNANQPTIVALGATQRPLTLQASPGRYVLRFDGVAPTRELSLRIAHPTSPQSLGQGEDARRLGVALTQVQIRGERAGEAAMPKECAECAAPAGTPQAQR